MRGVQFAPLASDARPAMPVSSAVSLEGDIDELVLVRAQLEQERASNTSLRRELEESRAHVLDQASSIRGLQERVSAGSQRDESAAQEADLMRAQIVSLRNEQAEATHVRAQMDLMTSQLAQTEAELKNAQELLATEGKFSTELGNAHTILRAEHARLIELAPSLEKQHDDACKKAFEEGRNAQQSTHQNQVTLLEQAHAKHIQAAQDKISLLNAQVSQGKEDFKQAEDDLHKCRARLRELEDAVNISTESLKANREHSQELEGKLNARDQLVKSFEEQLKALMAEHEGQLEAARAQQEEQDSRLYGAEVQLQNNQSMRDMELHQMELEMTKLRGVVARSASDADFVLSGRKLAQGKYMVLHTAVQSEYGIETYTRWFVEEDAAQVVEALGLRSTAHCAKYSLAFPPEWRLIPDSTKPDAEGFAALWRKEGDLWRWSKSIDELVRNFIDSLKRSTMTRGIKRPRGAGPFYSMKGPRTIEPTSMRQKQASDSQKRLEGPPAQLAIEAPPLAAD